MKAGKFQSLTSEILFVLSLAYLCAEVFFNVSLLRVAGDVRSSPAELEDIQFFGRIVSASGFTLLVLGLFARHKFQFPTAASWGVFASVAIFCLFPFLLVFGEITAAETIIWGFIPIWGLMLVISGKGYAKPPAIIGLILLAWPAMFFGQKILIDQYVVTPTSWQERLSARYILMLRSGLEGCVVELDGLSLCDKNASPQMSSVRVLIGALFMHNADRVLKDLESEREQIIESTMVWGKWFSPEQRYQAYLGKVEKERKKYKKLTKKFENHLRQDYWLPYSKASKIYLESVSDSSVQKIADEAWRQAEAGVDKGWGDYQSAVRLYKRTLLELGSKAVGYGVVLEPLYDNACKTRDCPSIDARAAVLNIRKDADDRFAQETGYPLDIETREEFLAQPKTQTVLREQVKAARLKLAGVEAAGLSKDWRYEELLFKADIAQLVRVKADHEWQTRFGADLLPGLDFPAFLERTGIELPELSGVTPMNESDFNKNWAAPAKNSAVDDSLKKIRDEAPSYAEGQLLQEWGRTYIRAIYVPAIALTLSLAIVLLTIGRYFVALVKMGIRRSGRLSGIMPEYMTAPALWAFFIIGVTFVSYIVPNAYASSVAYQKYLGYAREAYFPTAMAIDWVNHVEPLLHSAGSWIGK